MTEISETTANSETTSHTLKYKGTGSQLLPIVLLNLLFTIITIGIFRFWAKTNIRKYLWKNTYLDDEPFEYLGTGGELFVGSVIVGVVLSAGLFSITFLMSIIADSYPMLGPFVFILMYPLFIFLMGVAIYRAQVYRMSRTRWRR